MNILLLSRYTNSGASSRYRSFQYLPLLRQLGYQITVAPFFSDSYLKQLYSSSTRPALNVVSSYAQRVLVMTRSRKCDLLWIEYEAFPWMPYWLESLLTDSRTPYIVDYDDAVFHRYHEHTSGVVRLVLGNKIDRVMQHSALVIAGNEYIANHARLAGAQRVEILPTVIDLDRYPLAPLPQNQRYTVGWIGSFSTARYLLEIREALSRVAQESMMRLVVVGARPPDMNGVVCETREPWSEEREIEESFGFDVGIMPLPDSPWERGKCGHKLIKYMAASRPVISSPVGVNRDIVEHGVTGYLAETTSDWLTALSSLRDSRTLREQMGRAGRRKVEERYCIQVTGRHLANLLEEALKRPR